MGLLLTWLLHSLLVLVTARLLPGFKVKGLANALVVSALFGLLNFLLGWILFLLLGVISIGIGFLLPFLTKLVVNAMLLRMVERSTKRLELSGFGTAFIAAAMLSGLGTLLEMILKTH